MNITELQVQQIIKNIYAYKLEESIVQLKDDNNTLYLKINGHFFSLDIAEFRSPHLLMKNIISNLESRGLTPKD